jgi:predicted lysophospholipase L1 biosynthesis ABC-type transport system permease subunit
LYEAGGSASRWVGVSLVVVVFFVLWLHLRRRYGVDARLILREMAGRRMRTASTLLGLSVGLAGLSLISLTTSSVSNLLEIQFEERAEGNLLIMAQQAAQRDAVRDSLSELEGVEHFSQYTTFSGLLLEVNGEPAELHGQMNDFYSEEDDPRENSNFEVPRTGVSVFLSEREDLGKLPDYHMVSGRKLTPEDRGKPRIMIRESFITDELGLKTGDRLMIQFPNGPGDEDDVLLLLNVVGVVQRQSEQTGFGDQYMVPADTLPDTISPAGTFTIAQIDESDDAYMDNTLIAMSEVPGVLAIELSDITKLIEDLMEQMKAIPTLVAWLALVAGTAIIANTVALATQERRRQIGVMKAIGLKGRRVLVMLMIENGLIGLVAGLIGVFVGLLLTVVMVLASDSPDDLERTIEFSSILWLVIMSIGVAIGAAVLSAWSAAAEKPMNVLRYE